MLISRKSRLFLSALALVATFGLAACNTHVDEVDDNIQLVLDDAQLYYEQAKIPMRPQVLDTVITKDDIWLGEDSFKITGGEPLPLMYEAPDAITLSFNEPVAFGKVVEEMRDVTGLKFSIDELKLSNELPTDDLQINYTGSLGGLLDYLSHKYSIWWRHRKGQISFYKQETRVFTIYALPVESSSMSASLSGTPTSAGNGTGTGSGGSTTLSMNTDVKLSFWSNIENGIKQVLGEVAGSQMLMDPTSGTITVTAPPYALQKVALYVQALNEKASRQVAISVKVLQVSLENDDQYGLNLDEIFYRGSKHIGMEFAGPFGGAMGNTGAGMLSMTLLDGSWKDSTAVMQALSTQGKTALVTSTSVTTLNNKIAPVQVTTQENYVSKTTIEKDSDDGDTDTSVEMETDTLNYGFTMEILPRILDNGRLMMLFTMTLTDLISLTTFSSDGSSTDNDDDDEENSEDESSNEESGEKTVVQLPKMQTRGFVQEIAMRSGSTLVLTGFETVHNKTTKAGVGRPRLSVLGGQAYANQKRDVLVILLTPEILESPLSPETRMEHF